MKDIDNLTYLKSIPATELNAWAVQDLTLQDVVLGGFERPLDLANPEDPAMIRRQVDKLARHPERYSGYTDDEGRLVAYMKSGEWRAGDEAPFVEGFVARQSLHLSSMLRGGSLNPPEYGVFGLVSSENLPDTIRNEVAYNLLYTSMGKAAWRLAASVNIVLHDNDPVTPIATDLGFEPIGGKAEAAGAPGLLQQRYKYSFPHRFRR